MGFIGIVLHFEIVIIYDGIMANAVVTVRVVTLLQKFKFIVIYCFW